MIKVHQLPHWYQDVIALQQDPVPAAQTVCDYLPLLLYSGLRRQEAAQLTWDRVDLKDQTLWIPDPKNHQPHLLPLSTALLAILRDR